MGDLLEDRLREADRMTIQQPITETRFPSNAVNHPQHYGGDTTYEVIKVLEAWGLTDFYLGNSVKYIARHERKSGTLSLRIQDLKKARWYLDRKIQRMEESNSGNTDSGP